MLSREKCLLVSVQNSKWVCEKCEECAWVETFPFSTMIFYSCARSGAIWSKIKSYNDVQRLRMKRIWLVISFSLNIKSTLRQFLWRSTLKILIYANQTSETLGQWASTNISCPVFCLKLLHRIVPGHSAPSEAVLWIMNWLSFFLCECALTLQ